MMSKSMQDSLRREFWDWIKEMTEINSPFWNSVLIQCQNELFKAFVALHAKENPVERWLVTVQESSGPITKVVEEHPAKLHLEKGEVILFAIKVPEPEDSYTLF